MIDDPWETGPAHSDAGKRSLPFEARITQYLAGALLESHRI